VKLGRLGIVLLLLPTAYVVLNGYFDGGAQDTLAVLVCGDLATKPVVPTFDRYGCGFDLGNFVVGAGFLSVAAGALLLILDPPRF
jgi:hypothetical protein